MNPVVKKWGDEWLVWSEWRRRKGVEEDEEKDLEGESRGGKRGVGRVCWVGWGWVHSSSTDLEGQYLQTTVDMHKHTPTCGAHREKILLSDSGRPHSPKKVLGCLPAHLIFHSRWYSECSDLLCTGRVCCVPVGNSVDQWNIDSQTKLQLQIVFYLRRPLVCGVYQRRCWAAKFHLFPVIVNISGSHWILSFVIHLRGKFVFCQKVFCPMLSVNCLLFIFLCGKTQPPGAHIFDAAVYLWLDWQACLVDETISNMCP